MHEGEINDSLVSIIDQRTEILISVGQEVRVLSLVNVVPYVTI
jgi:hypothetical protein